MLNQCFLNMGPWTRAGLGIAESHGGVIGKYRLAYPTPEDEDLVEVHWPKNLHLHENSWRFSVRLNLGSSALGDPMVPSCSNNLTFSFLQ